MKIQQSPCSPKNCCRATVDGQVFRRRNRNLKGANSAGQHLQCRRHLRLSSAGSRAGTTKDCHAFPALQKFRAACRLEGSCPARRTPVIGAKARNWRPKSKRRTAATRARLDHLHPAGRSLRCRMPNNSVAVVRPFTEGRSR